jgi:inorganic pyrophosphatase
MVSLGTVFFKIATGQMLYTWRPHSNFRSWHDRFIKWSPVLFNYGALPQTYEDPAVNHPDTGKPGDADPLDVIDIGYARLERGEVVRVKVIGAMALIDEGETDWKILAINLNDPRANEIRSSSTLSVCRYPPREG